MAIHNNNEDYSVTFEGGINIGDIWYGNGVFVKPLDFPGGISYWQFGTTEGQAVGADAGCWQTAPTILNLYDNGAKAAGVEYVDNYGYNVVWYFENWGYNQIGADTWNFLVDYCNDNFYWVWGNVYSGVGVARVAGQSNAFKFYSFYGLYENETTGDKRIACSTTNMAFTLRQLQEGGFAWYTNIYPRESTGSIEGSRSSGVWWVSRHDNWGSGDHKAIKMGEYAMTNYTNGQILYGVTYNNTVSDTLTTGFTSNAFGGSFPNLYFELNCVESPYSGVGAVYTPHRITTEGYILTDGGPFIGASDTSAEYYETPAGGGGGAGNYDNSSDSQDLPDSSQFAIDALNSGLVTVFNPSKAQLTDFAKFIYNSDNITEAIANQLKRLLADPLDYIIGINIAHFAPSVSTSATINFGGVSTGVYAPVVSPQYQFLDCGSLDINEETASFQDYDMSNVKIYLPYCGIHTLDLSETMGGSVTLQYVIDCLSGSCVANIKVSRDRSHVHNDPDLEAILYSFTGNCFTQVPVTARDFQNTISGLLGVASSVGSFAGSAMTGNIGGAFGSVSGIVNSAMGMTPKAQQVGNYSSNFGYMQYQTPFLILQRPMASTPSEYEDYYGRPLYDNVQLNKCDGFTEIDSSTLWLGKYDFITQEEQNMLQSIANGGGIYIDHSSEYYDYNPED